MAHLVDRRNSAATARVQIGPKKKIALVCSGGATKAGAFHLGVALALQEQGFRFFGGQGPTPDSPQIPERSPKPMEISTYIGSSAGAIISTYLAAGYSPDNIFNSFLSRKPTDPADMVPKILPSLSYQKMLRLRPALAREQLKQLMLFRSIITDLLQGNIEAILQFKWLTMTGLFSTQGLENYIKDEVLPSNAFQDYLSELFIVATQLNHSGKTVFGKYDKNPFSETPGRFYRNDVSISEACAASTALPFVFAPYALKTKKGKVEHFIDGEIRETLSVDVAEDAGADLIIASHTHQPYQFSEKIGSLTKYGLPAILIQSIYLMIEQKIRSQKQHSEKHREAIDAVSQYCQQNGIAEKHRKRICEIMETELHHRTNVDTIYIHPDPADSKLFFCDHFSLSARKITEMVRSGFNAAIATLKKYDFADRNDGIHPINASSWTDQATV